MKKTNIITLMVSALVLSLSFTSIAHLKQALAEESKIAEEADTSTETTTETSETTTTENTDEPDSPQTAVPIAQIGDESYPSLDLALDAAEPNTTVTLLANLTTTSPIVINKPLTLDGNNHQISATLANTGNGVFHVETSDQVTIQNFTLTTNARGVAINTNVHHVALKNLQMTVGVRGIHTSQNNNHDSTLTVDDCLIQKSGYTNYDQEVPGGDYRGISLWQYSNSDISVKNTTIQGFSYVINLASENYQSPNTNLTIENSTLKGRAGLNIWTIGTNITLKDSKIVGINNFGGSSESFANIVVNQPAKVNLNIINTDFINFQNEVGLPNENALQHAIALRGSGSTVNISGNTTFTDTTDKLEDFFAPYDTENDITITSGTYDYDVSAYVPDGYQVLKKNNRYTVVKVTPATPDDAEIILPPASNNNYSFTLDQSAVDILQQSLKSSNFLANLTSADQITVTPELEAVDSSQVPTSAQAQIATELKAGHYLAQFFDLSVVVRVNNQVAGNLTELTGPIEFSLKLPTNLLKDNRRFYILRLHDGKVDRLNTELTGDTLTFQTDKFSTYALTYTDNPLPDNIPNNPSNSDPATNPDLTDSPDTGLLTRLASGDASAFLTLTLLAALSLSAGYAAYLACLRHTAKAHRTK